MNLCLSKQEKKKNRKSAADLKSFSNRQHFFILLEVLPQ